MSRILLSLLLFCLALSTSAQIVKIEPSDANAEQEIKVIFDAKLGNAGLVGAEKVYIHTGVVVESPTSQAWDFVIGNWGQDDGVGLMTKVEGQTDVWEFTLTPTAREYYNVPLGTNIFRLSMVFRNADGSQKGEGTEGDFEGGTVASNGDIYIDLNISKFIQITAPSNSDIFLQAGESVDISATASSDVTAMALSIDEGQGFVEKTTVSSGTTISFEYTPEQSVEAKVKVTATIDEEEVETIKALNVFLRGVSQEAALPAGLKKGINYHEDQTKVSLVLEAPGKEFVYAVGDFSDWEIADQFLMNKTPDGELFWIMLENLTAQQEYVFQYWVDGAIRIGDPYADKVADPWNDSFIPAEVNNEIPDYDRQDFGIATTFQTGQTPFEWAASEDSWTPPAKEDLVIYELLVRDFIGSHSYKDLIDTLDYVANLGVNAIELLPIMEFEGNESWGYNPSYVFAVDKYYGTKNDLKSFIQAAHEKGIAVILDMVLNHHFGQSPLVQMYWDSGANKPASDNPWFNPDARHPFNVGYDFNHESTYTKAYVDSVNHYWLSEYHFDGYRFDLSKGFTQTNNPDNVGAWSAFDQSRIDLLTRMADEIWESDEDAYVILEHFADGSEEAALAAEGMLLWRNAGFDYWSALGGTTTGSFTSATAATHVSYMESHDEQRQLWEVFQNGGSGENYNTRDTTIALERLKMNAAFLYTLPGPKMLWQFGELGYDIDINFNGRVGNKPLVWGEGNLGYYEDPLRQYVYDAFSAVINLRNEINNQTNVSYTYDFSGAGRSIVVDSDDTDIVIMGNFGLEEMSVTANFTGTGIWHDYFSGGPVTISEVAHSESLAPGEFRIYASNKLSDGFPNVVEAFRNPVTADPATFSADDEITFTFDATKASADGTAGLVGAEKVYMHSGVVLDDLNSSTLTNIVGNLTDDGVGQMTKAEGEDNLWEITLTPRSYYGLDATDEVVRIGMYFRDANNVNLGKGFRGSTIFFEVTLEGQLVSIQPEEFGQDDEITLTFDTRFGNRGLLGANKVYIHTGVVLQEGGTTFENTVGDWGQDNGVGLMTRSTSNTNQWTFTYTPEDYYSLGDEDIAYRLAMVFRNADGSQKGTGIPGDLENGLVIGNGDILIDIPIIKEVTSIQDELPGFRYYPNPARNQINFSGEFPGIPKAIIVYDLAGNPVRSKALPTGALEPVDISGLNSGLYLLRIFTDEKRYTLKVLVN